MRTAWVAVIRAGSPFFHIAEVQTGASRRAVGWNGARRAIVSASSTTEYSPDRRASAVVGAKESAKAADKQVIPECFRQMFSRSWLATCPRGANSRTMNGLSVFSSEQASAGRRNPSEGIRPMKLSSIVPALLIAVSGIAISAASFAASSGDLTPAMHGRTGSPHPKPRPAPKKTSRPAASGPQRDSSPLN